MVNESVEGVRATVRGFIP